MPPHKGRTKDESYMLNLYEESCKRPDMDDPHDRYHIGHLTGLQETATDTICQLLMRANFIVKRGEVEIAITPHGIKLVESLKPQ